MEQINTENLDPFIAREEVDWEYIDFVKNGRMAPDLKLGVRSIDKVDPCVGEAFISYRNSLLFELERTSKELSDFDRGKMTGHINLIDIILNELEIDWNCLDV